MSYPITPPPLPPYQQRQPADETTPSIPGLIGLILSIVGAACAVLGPLALGAWLFTLPALVLGIVGLASKGKRKGTSLSAVIISCVAFLVAVVMSITFLASSASNNRNETIALPEASNESNSATPKVNERGDILLALGENGVVNGYDGKPAFTFKATEIVRNPTCNPDPGYPVSAEGGDLIAIHIEMTTSSDYHLRTSSSDSTSLYWQNWSGISADGKKIENSHRGLNCFPNSESFPPETPAGETVSGWWVLNVDAGAERIAWRPGDSSSWEWSTRDGGWEWEVPVG